MMQPHTSRDRTNNMFEGKKMLPPWTLCRINCCMYPMMYCLSPGLHVNDTQIHHPSNLNHYNHLDAYRQLQQQQTFQAPYQQQASYGQAYGRQGNTSRVGGYVSSALEIFSLFGTLWEVYKTDEGYVYYLNSISKHSQWDDPRIYGLLHYDTEKSVDDIYKSFSAESQKDTTTRSTIQMTTNEQSEASFLKPRKAKVEVKPTPQPTPTHRKIVINKAEMTPGSSSSSEEDPKRLKKRGNRRLESDKNGNVQRNRDVLVDASSLDDVDDMSEVSIGSNKLVAPTSLPSRGRYLNRDLTPTNSSISENINKPTITISSSYNSSVDEEYAHSHSPLKRSPYQPYRAPAQPISNDEIPSDDRFQSKDNVSRVASSPANTFKDERKTRESSSNRPPTSPTSHDDDVPTLHMSSSDTPSRSNRTKAETKEN